MFGKEEDGYHGIETLFTLLELEDDLTFERTAVAGEVELSVEGPDAGPAEQNLAYLGAKAALDATGNRFGVRIRLAKAIPVAAGLGGGSSDGAAALHAVNALASSPIPRHEILQIASTLGSDVAFFASGAPLALGWGRGERLFRIDPPPAAPVLLAVPTFGISTREAYTSLDTARTGTGRRGSIVLDPTAFASWGGIGRLGGNDFEGPVFTKEPALRELFEKVAGTRPLLVRLSGSGSAVIAIYKNEGDRDDAAMAVGEGEQKLIRTATRPDPAPPPRSQ